MNGSLCRAPEVPVPDPANLAKAQFKVLKDDWTPDPSKPAIAVQFNPETLKVSYANQLVEPSSGGSKKGTSSRQFLGAGTTKLTLQLWFDVTTPPYSNQGTSDVRDLTAKISYFVTPTVSTLANQQDNTQFKPPGCRFLWGNFQFDGLMDSLEESLEFFSPEGNALRASLSVAMSRQKSTPVTAGSSSAGGGAGSGTGPGGQAPGTAPLTAAPSGSSLQQLADRLGVGADWQSIAAANGIENPRNLAPGSLIDLSARVNIGLGGAAPLGFSGAAGASAGVSVSVGAGAGVSIDTSLTN